jgi:hypothetical protein
MELLAQRMRTDREDVMYYYIASDGPRFAVIESRHKLTLNAPHDSEPSMDTRIYGFDSHTYWLINHIGAHFIEDLDSAPKDTEAALFARSFRNRFMLEFNTLSNLGFYGVPKGHIVWHGTHFFATNVYDQKVKGELIQMGAGSFPEKLKYTTFHEGESYEAFIQYHYSPNLELGEHPAGITIARDEEITDLQLKRYEILAVRVARRPEKLLSPYQYLRPSVTTLTQYRLSGAKEYGRFDYETYRRVFFFGHWVPQKYLASALFVGCVLLLSIPLLCLLKYRHKGNSTSTPNKHNKK